MIDPKPTMSPVEPPPPAYHDHDFSKTSKSERRRLRKRSPSQSGSVDPPKSLDNDKSPLQVTNMTCSSSRSSRSPLDISRSMQFNKIIAIPQEMPNSHSPFVQAWTPSLLSYGIPRQSFTSFLSTLSSIFEATTSEAAIAHAGRLTRSTIVDLPASFGKGVAGHACSSAKHFGQAVKSGNPFAMVGATLGGTVGLTVGVTGRLIGTVFSVPGALLQKPQSARQRAETFLEGANRKWFSPRGLCAKIMTVDEIAALLGLDVERLTSRTESAQGLEALMPALEEHMECLEFGDIKIPQGRRGRGSNSSLPRITRRTLWLVILPAEDYQTPPPE